MRGLASVVRGKGARAEPAHVVARGRREVAGGRSPDSADRRDVRDDRRAVPPRARDLRPAGWESGTFGRMKKSRSSRYAGWLTAVAGVFAIAPLADCVSNGSSPAPSADGGGFAFDGAPVTCATVGSCDATVVDSALPGNDAATPDGASPPDGGPLPDTDASADAADAGPLDSGIADAGEVDTGVTAACPIAPGQTTDAGALALARGVTIYSVASDGTDVFWVNRDPSGGSIAKIPVGGGATTLLATNRPTPAVLTLDGTRVIWAEYYSIESIAKTGAAAPTFIANADLSFGIAVSGGVVGWIEANLGAVFAAPTSGLPDGGTSIVISSPTVAGSIGDFLAGDGNNFYWIGNNHTLVLQASKNGIPDGGSSSPMQVGTGNYMFDLQVGPGFVVWTDVGLGEIVRAPVGGGTPTVLASGRTSPARLAIDATDVYWTETSGAATAIVSAPLTGVPDGGSPTVLAVDPSSVTAIAADGTYVYWADQCNMVFQITR